MYDQPSFTPPPVKRSRVGLKIALVGAGIAAGAIGATAIGAGATTAGSGSTSSTSGSAATSTVAPSAPSGAPSGMPGGPGHGGRPADAHGAAPVRGDEKQVTGTTAATLKAAALKAVPGGTVYRVETDSGDAKYEVHMTKSDGTEVTVKFDANLKQTAVETGMGK